MKKMNRRKCERNGKEIDDDADNNNKCIIIIRKERKIKK